MVFCIFKDALAVDAAHHDMINSCARLDAAFPWHDTITIQDTDLSPVSLDRISNSLLNQFQQHVFINKHIVCIYLHAGP